MRIWYGKVGRVSGRVWWGLIWWGEAWRFCGVLWFGPEGCVLGAVRRVCGLVRCGSARLGKGGSGTVWLGNG